MDSVQDHVMGPPAYAGDATDLTRDWAPFVVTPGVERAPLTRPIHTKDGILDRLRAVAFAEFQAREAFLWAAATFGDRCADPKKAAPASLVRAWGALAAAEDRHMNWLLTRFSDLGGRMDERPVSNHLWQSLVKCDSAEMFAIYIANSEERGRQAGERFHRELLKIDPVSAEIFHKIAEEEVAHIALAAKYYPGSKL